MSKHKDKTGNKSHIRETAVQRCDYMGQGAWNQGDKDRAVGLEGYEPVCQLEPCGREL